MKAKLNVDSNFWLKAKEGIIYKINLFLNCRRNYLFDYLIG